MFLAKKDPKYNFKSITYFYNPPIIQLFKINNIVPSKE